jgi:hypothetical protein
MGAQSTVIAYETIKSIDSGTFTGSYLPIGIASTHEARIFKIVNNSNVGVTISVDGSTDVDFVPASTFVLYDVCTNRSNAVPLMDLPKGTQFYAKAAAGTGLVYVVILYGFTPAATIPL